MMRKLFVLVLIIAQGIAAQIAFKNGVFITQKQSMNAYAYPGIFDFNGDGSKDMLIGVWNDNLQYYQNSGTDSSPVFQAAADISNITSSGF